MGAIKGKNIVVGVCGGIAAYKTASLVRLFVKAGADVQVIMTPSAKEFITPLTMSTLSRHAVITEFLQQIQESGTVMWISVCGLMLLLWLLRLPAR